MDKPDWLPAELNLSGSWETIRDSLYEIFQRDIKGQLLFRGIPVEFAKYPIEQGCEEGFWHVTSKNEWVYDQKRRCKVKERIFDEKRSRKLPWLRPLLENPNDPAVKTFNYREDSGKLTTYIWLEELNYVVLLGPSQSRQSARCGGPCWYLISAYSVDYQVKRADLANKYKNREA